MSKILVSGSLAYDHIMDFAGLFSEHMMPDKLHSINLSFLVDKLAVQFGGCAGNIAYTLAMLGEQPQIIGTAGSDFSNYHAHLLHAGVDPSSIRIAEKELTSSAYILTDKADNQIAAFYPGAGATAYDMTLETEGRAFAIIAPGSVADMRDLPAYYRKRNLKYIYDPAQQIPALSAEMIKDGITGALALFGSDYEYALIQQKTGWSEADILQHTPTVVVTYGSKGSDIISATGTAHVEASPAQAVIDPTGAGDAYRAGYIKGLIVGFSPEGCAKLASVVAAYAVESHGTQTHQFSMEDLKNRYQKTYHETLSI